MSSPEEISKLLLDNLFGVFGELDPQKRLVNLNRLWVADCECLFLDPMGVLTSHREINSFIGKLLEQNKGRVFSQRG
jgi:hypothetical protein